MGYSKVGGRRGGNAAWQWIIIGFFPGLLCGGIVIFSLLIVGVVPGMSGSAGTPMVVTSVVERVQIITPTPDPNMPTATAMIITATPEPTTVQVVAPTSTPPPAPTDSAASGQLGGGSLGSSDGSLGGDASGGMEESIAPTLDLGGGAAIGAGTAASEIPSSLQAVASTLVTVPGTTFQMGTTPDEVLTAVNLCLNRDAGQCQLAYGEDSNPPFQVQLSPYQIETTEVTFGQYIAFLNYLRSQGQSHLNGCMGFICVQTQNERPDDGVISFDSANYSVPETLINHPVYGVSWYGAQAYCETLGRRLPSEAEWERAARGEDGRIYPWGNEWAAALANTSRTYELPNPVPVGSFVSGASPVGALDMAGNMSEWVNDWYNPNYYTQMSNQPQPVQNPPGPATGVEKVLRGGSWDALPFFARSVHRQSYEPAPATANGDYPRWVGFRCAADPANPAGVAPGQLNPADLGAGLSAEPAANATLNAQPGLPPPTDAPAVAPPEAEAEASTQRG